MQTRVCIGALVEGRGVMEMMVTQTNQAACFSGNKTTCARLLSGGCMPDILTVSSSIGSSE